MQGPYPIFCRGHSGGRILCEAYMRNGIQMGVVTDKQKDTPFFAVEKNPVMREIILHAYDYLNAEAALQSRLQELMRQTVRQFRETEIRGEGPFGWKNGHNIFALPVLLDALPTAKIVHLIRDGRDVMLSRLNIRIERLDDPVNRLMVFGDANTDSFEGRRLSSKTVKNFRNELEMRHWVTSVEYGLAGRKYEGRYLEIRYEQLCTAPVEVMQKIFDFIAVPFLEETKEWVRQAASTSRIDKWKTQPPEALAMPLAIGGDLLRLLGYLQSS